jgi:hypothetical protein
MPRGKALGIDEVTSDMTKAAGPIGIQWLYRVLKQVWKSGNKPQEWRKGIIIPVHKSGRNLQCSNYKGITLLSHCFKIYESVILNEIKKKIEDGMREEQHGFRAGRSTIDLIFSIQQVTEK